MKALTLTQPWATLVAIGGKRVETRSWGPATICGQRIAIHAAKAMPDSVVALCYREPFSTVLARVAGTPAPEDLPRGAVVATATVAGILRTENPAVDQYLDSMERTFGDYSPGRFAWRLADVTRLEEPVPCRGHQRLWELPPDVTAKVRELVPA